MILVRFVGSPLEDMDGPYLLCTDGSELSHRAITSGLARLRPGPAVLVVTVVDAPDPMLVTGTGIAGGTMSPDDFERAERRLETDANAVVSEAATRLGRDEVETRVLRGDPGTSLCDLAAAVSASALVVGSRGRGGLKRALLGSVSDYVVRNAPCPVVVVGATDGTPS